MTIPGSGASREMAAMVDSDATEPDGDRTILVDITHFKAIEERPKG